MTNAKANGAVTTKTDKLPAMNFDSLEQYAGTGLDTITTDDIAKPRLKVLAQMSPELEEIEGAKAGMILNSVSKKAYSGQDGINVVVCGYEKVWLEWQDRGKGSSAPVNIYSAVDKPANAVRGDDGKFRLDTGNYLENRQDLFTLKAQLDMAMKSGDISAVRSIYEDNKKQLSIIGRMKAIDNARNRMQRQIKEIERNPRIPEETKKKIIRIRRQKINELQQRGLILMRSVGYKKAG